MISTGIPWNIWDGLFLDRRARSSLHSRHVRHINHLPQHPLLRTRFPVH